MRTRTLYIPATEAESGMRLATPLKVVSHGRLRLSLPAGHELTEDNLQQMTISNAEFIFVVVPDLRSDEQIAIDTAEVAHRAMDIFAGADLSEPVTAALFDQILAYRNA